MWTALLQEAVALAFRISCKKERPEEGSWQASRWFHTDIQLVGASTQSGRVGRGTCVDALATSAMEHAIHGIDCTWFRVRGQWSARLLYTSSRDSKKSSIATIWCLYPSCVKCSRNVRYMERNARYLGRHSVWWFIPTYVELSELGVAWAMADPAEAHVFRPWGALPNLNRSRVVDEGWRLLRT